MAITLLGSLVSTQSQPPSCDLPCPKRPEDLTQRRTRSRTRGSVTATSEYGSPPPTHLVSASASH